MAYLIHSTVSQYDARKTAGWSSYKKSKGEWEGSPLSIAAHRSSAMQYFTLWKFLDLFMCLSQNK